MRLKDIYAQGKPVVSFEFFPTKTLEAAERFTERLKVFQALRPDYSSVTYGAGGGTRDRTFDLVRHLKYGNAMEILCHLTCIAHSRAEVDYYLHRLKNVGIENLLALRGDERRDAPGWVPPRDHYRHAAELVRQAKALGDFFSVAVAGFPEKHPESPDTATDLRFLKEKADAGADVVITQLFFDNAAYYRYRDQARALGVTIPIVPGILPVRSVEGTRKFTAACGASIPPALNTSLDRAGTDRQSVVDFGVNYATAQCGDLLKNGAPGLHFYTLNESSSVQAILSNLELR